MALVLILKKSPEASRSARCVLARGRGLFLGESTECPFPGLAGAASHPALVQDGV